LALLCKLELNEAMQQRWALMQAAVMRRGQYGCVYRAKKVMPTERDAALNLSKGGCEDSSAEESNCGLAA
jgi:hypothetical protein